MCYVRTWTRHVRHGIASLFTLVLISSPVVAYGQTVTAMWDPSPPSDEVTSYQVCISATSMSCNVQLASVSEPQTTYTFTPTPGVVHYVAIRAINSVGAGSYSTETSFSIPSFIQPVNQSSPVGVAITPLNMSVTDPDGSARNFTHTGLPPGLALNATTGQITGTPSAAGTYNVTIFVTDSLVTVSRSFVWTITASSGPVTSVALTSTVASPQNTSTAITFIANSSGGVAPVQFKFLVQPAGGAAQVVQDWSAATTYTWAPATAGTYTVILWARSAGVTADAAQASAQMAYVVNTPPAPVTSATLTSTAASPQNVGTAITFTAHSSGGVASHEYKFLLSQGVGAAQEVRTWSTAPTYIWTPPAAGTYTMVVWARSAGVTADAAQASAQMAYVVNTPAPAPVTSATLTSTAASPQNVGTAITFTAHSSGGVASHEYKFLLSQSGGAAQEVRTWSAATTYTWTPPAAGTYTMVVWARSAGVTADAAQASAQMAYVVNTQAPAPVTSATLTSTAASPQNVGTAITFTAHSSGGVASHEYKFLLSQGVGAAQEVRTWSTATTYTWTPPAAGTYTMVVWARSAGVTADAAQASAQMAYVVNTPAPAPVTSATLTSTAASPQNVGTAITFTANSSGGVASHEYKFLLSQGGGAAQEVRTWSAATTYTWTPPAAGTYTMVVWARSAGVTADAAQASAQMAYVVNTQAPAPVTSATLTSTAASPQNIGTAITFTAHSSGGVASHEYKFLLSQGGGAAQEVRTWSTATTYTWTPPTAGTYTMVVWARSAGVTADAAQASAQMAYVVNTQAPAPVTSATLTSTAASPQNTGTAITFTAHSSGGVASHEYKFLLSQGGGAAQEVRTWSTATTYTWTPPAAGTYTMVVWARSAGVTADAAQASAQMAYVVNTPPPAPVTSAALTSTAASPQNTGTAITFTAWSPAVWRRTSSSSS